MRILYSLLLITALSAALPCASRAQASAAPKGFEAYAIVRTRNIFDPDRTPYIPSFVAPRPRPVEQPRRSPDLISLTGIMVNGGKSYAFFFGSRSDDDKVLAVNGEIAGAKLAKINPTAVELDQNGKKINVSIGQTMSFDSSSPGSPLTPASPADSIGSIAEPAPAESLPQTANQPPGNLSDVMRRMMERRQQELK